jgi:hypothetical protein
MRQRGVFAVDVTTGKALSMNEVCIACVRTGHKSL